MSTSVIEILKGFITPNLLNGVGSAIGIPGDVAGRGLTDLVGQYLGALVQQSGDRDAMAHVAELANSVSRDTSGINDIKGLLAGGIPSTMAVLAGNRLMGSLFGVWQASTVHKTASALNIGPVASSSLFNLAAPLVLSAISKRLGGGALTGAALTALIGQEKGAMMSGLSSLASNIVSPVKAAAPAAVAPAAVAAAAPVAAAAVKAATRTAAPAAAAAPAYAGRDNGLFTSFLWLLIPLAFIGWLAWQKLNEPPAEPPAPVAAAEPAAAPAPAAAARPEPAAGFTRIGLAGGADIDAATDGVESKIIAFINDPAAAIDKTIWFNFDRLTFETGSTSLTSDSKAQVDNIVAILNAYPAVKIKIGGYTDNVGDPQANLDLSGNRATKVMQAIVAGGIAADRVEAEGYGDQFPVADNATDEGRAQNRRTSVSIRAK
jgi:outer membrane protein OmpA-like peptidoglycan-associated protein